jgi:hypothetical protein
MHRRRLPIANPCPEDFAAMNGAGASRHCERCDKAVTDLSQMTELQAKVFLLDHGSQRVCVRYRARPDGTIAFRAPPPIVGRAAGLFGVSLALAGCAGYAEPAELASPTAGELCEDTSGYTIPCTDAPEVAEVVVPVVEPGGSTPPQTTPTETTPPTLPEGEDTNFLGQTVTPATGEGCPIPTPDPNAAIDDPHYAMGDVDPEYMIQGEIVESARSRRALRRAERQERRRERRAERRG